MGKRLRRFIVLMLFVLTSVSLTSGLQLSASTGDNGGSSSMGVTYGATVDDYAKEHIQLNTEAGTLSNAYSGTGSLPSNHIDIRDTKGNYAKVYRSISGKPVTTKWSYDWNTYRPTSSTAGSGVGAWLSLTASNAYSISGGSCSSNSEGDNAQANTDINSDPLTASWLGNYYTCATAFTNAANAYQTASIGIGSCIELYGSAKDSSGLYSVNTQLDGLSDIIGGTIIKGKASFVGLSGSSLAGSTTKAVQSEQVHGVFTSTTKAATQTTTRTSNYGSDYDISLRAAKSSSGPVANGIVGYYVTPFMKIQRAVNAAASGDTINIAAWTFKENVRIDKSLTLIGAGASSTIVYGNKADSVFTIGSTNPNIDVTLSGLKIQNGRALYGGGIFDMGKLTLVGSTLSGNSATYLGGGIYSGDNLFIGGTSQIVNNQATTGYGGGIFSDGSVTFYGTKVAVKNNRAFSPAVLPSGAPWYQQYGVFMPSVIPTTFSKFNPATQVTGNTKI
jgi:predicted outer membrane repeat protein